MATRRRTIIAGAATILMLTSGVAVAKDWTKDGDIYGIAVWGSAFSVERDALITAASLCVALDANYMEEKEREALSRQAHINGILTTTSGLSISFRFHPAPGAGRGACAPLADEKKVRKYKKQLAKSKK